MRQCAHSLPLDRVASTRPQPLHFILHVSVRLYDLSVDLYARAFACGIPVPFDIGLATWLALDVCGVAWFDLRLVG